MSIQAMKQVVKEAVYHRGGYWIIPEKEFECIRQAIAEAEKQEPFGVMCINCGSSWSDERLAEEKEKNSDLIACCPERKMVNVYTHPQPKREWVGLTDEQCLDLAEGCTAQYHDLLALCRAIEAAHGIKENT